MYGVYGVYGRGYDILNGVLEVHVRIYYMVLVSLLPNISIIVVLVSKSRTNLFSILKLYSVLKSSIVVSIYLLLYSHCSST